MSSYALDCFLSDVAEEFPGRDFDDLQLIFQMKEIHKDDSTLRLENKSKVVLFYFALEVDDTLIYRGCESSDV